MISSINPTLSTALSLWQSGAESPTTATTAPSSSTSSPDPRPSARTPIDAIFAILKAQAQQRQSGADAQTAPVASDAPSADLQKLLEGQLGTTAQAAEQATVEAQAMAASADGGGPAAALIMKASGGSAAASIGIQANYTEMAVAPETLEQMQKEALTYVANNSLSSQTISNILYGGGSLASLDDDETPDTFGAVLNELSDDAKSLQNWTSGLADWELAGQPDNATYSGAFSGQSTADIAQFAAATEAQAGKLAAEVTQMAIAFQNHTLSFEKATDVKGLDYSETYWSYEIGGAGGTSGDVSQNKDFLFHNPDGKNHEEMSFGGVMMFLTF